MSVVSVGMALVDVWGQPPPAEYLERARFLSAVGLPFAVSGTGAGGVLSCAAVVERSVGELLRGVPARLNCPFKVIRVFPRD